MLQGRLDEFGLPDVFQLLAFTKKSGVLRVVAGESEGRVHFEEGGVCFAVADTRRSELGARLLERGVVSGQHLDRVGQAQRDGDLRSLAAFLAEVGDADEDVLRRVVREQLTDAVFTLLRQDAGDFWFDTSSGQPAGLLAVPGDELIAEAGRMLVEWERLQERIPSPNSVLAMSANLTDERVTLDAAQWRLLARIDGRRTVADITGLDAQVEYATGQVLAGLLDAGLVEVARTPDSAGAGPAVADQQPPRHREDLTAPSRPAPAPAATVTEPARPGPTPPSPVDDPARERLAALRRRMQTVGAAPPRPAAVRGRAIVQADGAAPTANAGPDGMAERAAEADDVAVGESATAPRLVDAAPGTTPPQPDPHTATDAAPEPADPPVPAAVPYLANSAVDRASVARELAALGLDDDGPATPPPSRLPPPAVTSNGGNGASRRLTRDEEVSKGLLLRLIDGVKGA